MKEIDFEALEMTDCEDCKEAIMEGATMCGDCDIHADERLKVLDLFSGIGGFSLGLERAGMETVAFCEQDKHCQKVLKKHWPEIPIFEDVKTLKAKNLNEPIDVICGGFPCQDVSIAGQKKGFKDDLEKRTRSGLWEEFARIIKEVKPRYAIIENVANLRNLGLNQVIKDLWKIGYACEWHIISARSIGAPHLRERIWIIAYPNSDTIWEQSRRGIRKKGQNEVLIRNTGKNGETSHANSKRLERCNVPGSGNKTISQERLSFNCIDGSSSYPSNTDMPRLWKPFTSEEEKSQWWAETTSSFRTRWEVESRIRRVDDGLSAGMERDRKERIKQLGNSVVPQIPEIIGRAIMEYENEK